MSNLAVVPDQSEWTQIKEIASMAVKSGLLPSAIKTPEQAAIIALKGRELGLPPMVAFSHINVIQGKPTMSAEIMLAYIYRDHPQAQIKIEVSTIDKCVIKAKRPNEEEFTTFEWTIERARRMGLAEKDNWKKQPDTMLRWRAISEMKRVKFPEVLMGIDYTPEEVETASGEAPPRQAQPPANETTPVAEIRKIRNHAPGKEHEVIEIKTVETPPPAINKDELLKSIASHRARLKWPLSQMGDFVAEHFEKRPADLTEEQLKDLESKLAAL